MRISSSHTHQRLCASICDHLNEFKQLPQLHSRLLPPSKDIDANGSRKVVGKRRTESPRRSFPKGKKRELSIIFSPVTAESLNSFFRHFYCFSTLSLSAGIAYL